MERFVKGDIVVTPFPFSDVSNAKLRPALVLFVYEDEIILAEITSRMHTDPYTLPLRNGELQEGNLMINSWVRINKLFTLHQSLMLYKLGSLKDWKKKITKAVIAMFAQ